MSRDAPLLRDEIALREASLADAQRELAAGELSAESFAAISQREHAAITKAQEELDVLNRTSIGGPPALRVRRRRLLALSVACFLVALAVVLWASLVPRQPGTSITGSVSLGHAQHIQQLLTEAQADIASGNDVAALNAYQQVLALDGSNVQALTETGWLDFSAGGSDHNVALIDLGIKDLREAVKLAPRDAAPRLYYAIAADLTPGNLALAKKQFEVFLKLKPSQDQVDIAKPILAKLGLKAP